MVKMALCCYPRWVALRTCLLGLLVFSAAVVVARAAAPADGDAPLDGQARSTENKQVEGHFGRMTLFDQVLGYALGRFVNGFTAQQSKINFEQYLNPAEKELSVLLHALELFQQTVLPPVMEVANLPYEALKVAMEEVDSLFEALFGSEVFDGAPGSIGFGSVDGSCDKSKTYSIRSPDDLQNQRADLECIFAGGEAPRRPPLGIVVGRVHEAGATGEPPTRAQLGVAGGIQHVPRNHDHNPRRVAARAAESSSARLGCHKRQVAIYA